MAWLIVFISILAVVIFLAAMYFGFKNVALQEGENNIGSQEIDLEKLSTMVANKIISAIREEGTGNHGANSSQYISLVEENKIKGTSNIIDINSRIEGLRNVGN